MTVEMSRSVAEECVVEPVGLECSFRGLSQLAKDSNEFLVISTQPVPAVFLYLKYLPDSNIYLLEVVVRNHGLSVVLD